MSSRHNPESYFFLSPTKPSINLRINKLNLLLNNIMMKRFTYLAPEICIRTLLLLLQCTIFVNLFISGVEGVASAGADYFFPLAPIKI